MLPINPFTYGVDQAEAEELRFDDSNSSPKDEVTETEDTEVNLEELDFNKLCEKIALSNVKLLHTFKCYLRNEVKSIEEAYKAQVKIHAGTYRSKTAIALTAGSALLQGAKVVMIAVPTVYPAFENTLRNFTPINLDITARFTDAAGTLDVVKLTHSVNEMLSSMDQMVTGVRHVTDTIAQGKRAEAQEETSHMRSRSDQMSQDLQRRAADLSDGWKKLDQFTQGEHSEKMGIAR